MFSSLRDKLLRKNLCQSFSSQRIPRETCFECIDKLVRFSSFYIERCHAWKSQLFWRYKWIETLECRNLKVNIILCRYPWRHWHLPTNPSSHRLNRWIHCRCLYSSLNTVLLPSTHNAPSSLVLLSLISCKISLINTRF